ncbi:sulfate transporter family-domain-containing protein [Dioszegia hungarica]|uniref:Sulfate transporter family-domain-containing protein n=1 Tax=Dioszegia hungarica TaxID=4972 RepID=A0AA38LTM8_9TREE|nr:sulfate transporter family-domain-containing protein [Dioszegia hungarica]KAI9632716.1 sulfate transporter family-domain-containing protein [Dioszegia hungarica]
MPSADLAARTQQENAAAGPSRPASRSSLKSNLSAQLSGLFSRNSMDTTNERSALLPPSRASGSAGHSRESTDPGAGSSVGGGGIRRNYTQEMDGNEEEEDGKIPAAARTPQRPPKKRMNTKEMAKKIRQRSKYYIPITEWLPQYSLPVFYGDLTAGVSLACLLVPQAMSYASGLAKLTPVAGIWSTALPSLIYGIFGTCRQLSVGPEAALSLLIGQMIQEVVNDPDHPAKHPELEGAAIAIVTTFQIGLITSVLGLLRLGFLDVVLSRALLRGFITAVGIIIFIEQSIPMLGLSALLASIGKSHNAPSLPLDKLAFVIQHIQQTNRPTAILSAACLAFLILMRVAKARIVQRPGGGWVRYIPEIFIAVVGLTFLAGQLRWDRHGIDILGEVSGGTTIPIGWPLDKRRMKYFSYTFPTAFVCAVVGMVDSIVAARENGSKYGYAVGPNRELVALGAANLVSSCMVATGSIPIFGSITRSRLNGATGARTQIASAITAVIMIGSIFLLPWLYFLPKAVLACIVVLVVYSILAEAPHEIIFLWRMRAWTDFLQMTGTFFLTLLFSIETGLVASVVFSLILVIQKSTQTRIKIIGRLPNTDEWVPIDEDEAAQEEIPGVLVVRIRENLSFANTGQLKERLRRLELYGMQKSHPSDAPRRESAKAVILHMGDVETMDASALQILYELTKSYSERGVGLHFVHLHPAHLTMFQFVGITDIYGPHHFHRDLREAMKEIENLGYGNSVVSRF